MGILRLALGEGTTNMKLFVFACLLAMALADAEPKADADPYYGYYGLGYHGLGYRAYGYGLGHYGYGHGLGYYGGYYGKRSADAEPTAVAEAKADADPYYGYYGLGHAYGYGLGHAYGYGLGHYGYAGLGHYGYGLGYYGKRSAEAEPAADAEAKADPYYGHYGHGYGYGLGYHGLGHYGYGHGLYGYYG